MRCSLAPGPVLAGPVHALVLAFAIALLAIPAGAGPWPRGKGETFLSFSGQAEEPDAAGRVKIVFSSYAEHGLTPRLTLGLDLFGDGTRMSKAIAFLRRPLLQERQEWKLAGEVGLGQVDGLNVLRPGLSLGRGVRILGRHGWITLDTRAVLLMDHVRVWEADLTLGLSAMDRLKLIVQLQGGAPDAGRAHLRVAPSAVWRFGPGRHLELGVSTGLDGHTPDGLKLGMWLEF